MRYSIYVVAIHMLIHLMLCSKTAQQPIPIDATLSSAYVVDRDMQASSSSVTLFGDVEKCQECHAAECHRCHTSSWQALADGMQRSQADIGAIAIYSRCWR
jgi:hypothetical protein